MYLLPMYSTYVFTTVLLNSNGFIQKLFFNENLFHILPYQERKIPFLNLKYMKKFSMYFGPYDDCQRLILYKLLKCVLKNSSL